MTYYGVTFNDTYHTWHDWGLKMVSFHIPMPEPKEDRIDIPGGDGSLDFTESGGRPMYNDRTGVELVFDLCDTSFETWYRKYSEFAKTIHGRKIKMVLDDEPEYYYMVRLNIDGNKIYPEIGEITMTGTAEPFKYDVTASNEDWLWDTFSFETGIIRELRDITITAENNTVTILGGGIDTAPVFIVTENASLQLTHGGRTYWLKVGRNRFPAVRVGSEDVTLQFSGTGKLSIEYRGRYL